MDTKVAPPELKQAAPAVVNSTQAADPKHPAHETYAKPEHPTKGEKIFHDVTYVGVGYIANLLVSLVIWDFFITGKGKGIHEAMSKGGTSSLKALGMSEKTAANWAHTGTEMAFSPLGGHVMMAPIMFLEDNARFLTHRFNQLFDKDYKYKDLNVTIEAPEKELPPLADEPTKQTVGEVALRRGLGWVGVIAAGTMLGNFQGGKYRDLLEGTTLKAANSAIEWTGSKTLKNLNKNPTVQRYLKLAALDVYFTALTSSITALTKRTFGKDKDKNGDGEHAEPAQTTAVATADTSPALPTTPECPDNTCKDPRQVMERYGRPNGRKVPSSKVEIDSIAHHKDVAPTVAV